jgi:hypothetical protein
LAGAIIVSEEAPMKPTELELYAMECLLLAQEVPDSRQRQILQETGVSWLRVADQVKGSSTKRGLRGSDVVKKGLSAA